MNVRVRVPKSPEHATGNRLIEKITHRCIASFPSLYCLAYCACPYAGQLARQEAEAFVSQLGVELRQAE